MDGGPGADGGGSPLDANLPKTCSEVKARDPAARDGAYEIDPDGAGPLAPFSAVCDQESADGPGWMLVTPDLVSEESVAVTTAIGKATNGGVVVKVYPNSSGCDDSGPRPVARHTLRIADVVPWTEIRHKQTFAGAAPCWYIFGTEKATAPTAARILPFVKGIDGIRGEVRMGGSQGNAFDGRTERCDNDPKNFWLLTHQAAGPKSATVRLRRAPLAGLAGPSTTAECGETAPEMTGATWWEYREVWIR